MSEYERRALAYHESGHAVIAELLSLPTRGVSIIPREGSSGRHTLTGKVGDVAPWRAAVWIYAGPASETRFRGSPARLAVEDHRFARELLGLTKKAHEDLDALAARYESLATANVLLHQKWIARVAAALLASPYRCLTAVEVRRLRPAEDR